MRKFLNHWLLLGAISVGIMSCGDDDEPVKKVHKADFTTSVSGAAVTVTNTTTNGASYSWNFGDGSAAVVTASTAAYTHTYTTGGAKTITLTSTAATGASPATSVATKVVTPAIPAAPPTASFSTAVLADGQVKVTNTSTNGASYSWNFGDGSDAVVTTSTADYVHIYSTAGAKTITLIVTGAAGTTPATATQSVTPTFESGFGPNLIKGSGFDTADAAFWTFTDSNNEEPNPSYTFGATANLPTGSDGKGLLIVNSQTEKGEGGILSQAIEVATAGTYLFSVQVKISEGPASIPEVGGVFGPNYHSWYEWYVSPDAPVDDNGFADFPAGVDGAQPIHRTRDWIFGNSWDGPFKANDGNWSVANVSVVGPRLGVDPTDGTITITPAGTYYVVNAFGKAGAAAGQWGFGSYGPNGIGTDNVKLRKKL